MASQLQCGTKHSATRILPVALPKPNWSAAGGFPPSLASEGGVEGGVDGAADRCDLRKPAAAFQSGHFERSSRAPTHPSIPFVRPPAASSPRNGMHTRRSSSDREEERDERGRAGLPKRKGSTGGGEGSSRMPPRPHLKRAPRPSAPFSASRGSRHHRLASRLLLSSVCLSSPSRHLRLCLPCLCVARRPRERPQGVSLLSVPRRARSSAVPCRPFVQRWSGFNGFRSA